jgi:hypothetical protein
MPEGVQNRRKFPVFSLDNTAWRQLHPTIGLKLLLLSGVHHAVTAHPTAEWVARTEAFPWDTAPRYLVRDRDAVYGHVVKRHLRALGIRDRPTAPRSPWQNAYEERLIGFGANALTT